MQDSQRPLTTNLQLDEAVIRLAERIAERYNLTPQQLIETLLLDCQEREPAPAAPAPARRKSRGRVIEMAAARQRREERLSMQRGA